MLVELTIIPLGGDTHMSDEVTGVIKVIDASGLPYQLTPCGTCIEGDWSEVMALVRRCHEQVRKQSAHVITMLQIEDQEGAQGKLRHNVASVTQKLGKPAQRMAS